jgi:hypothetical protein
VADIPRDKPPLKVEALLEMLHASDPLREVLIRIDDTETGHTYTRRVARVYVDRGYTVLEGTIE